MKKIKTLLCAILVVAMLSGVLVVAAACSGNGEDGYKEVEGKTNIRVATYNGGLGKAWLEKAARTFEAMFADTSFEEGKTGVAVSVEYCAGGNMMEEQVLNMDVYFTEVVDYFKYVSMGKVADITDVVTGDLQKVGESGKTIESKLDASFREFLTAKDGKYYAIPFYEGYMGFVFDRDLFADKGYFKDANGNWTGDEDNLSVGADGISGTYDDGLPVTYSDFKALVEKMRKDNVTPFILGDDALDYFQKLLAGFWADYEGKESMLKNWNFSGSFNIVTGFDSKGNPILGTATFDDCKKTEDYATRVKELQKQPGKYYALKFLQDVVCSDGQNYDSMPYQSAQLALIASNLGDYSEYGMLMDGVWWENEASLAGSFSTVSVDDLEYDGNKDDYKQSRRFSFMPFPVEDAKYEAEQKAGVTHKQTLYSANDAFCFISSNSSGAKLEVAKLFMQFVHTDSQMSSFTATTSIPRALNYELASSDKVNMTYFGQNVMEIKGASDIVYPYSGHSYYVSNSTTFALQEWGWKNGNNNNPFTVMKGGVTAVNYFNGLYSSR